LTQVKDVLAVAGYTAYLAEKSVFLVVADRRSGEGAALKVITTEEIRYV